MGGVTLHAETAVIKATEYTYSDDATTVVDASKTGTIAGITDYSFSNGDFSATPFKWYSSATLTITPVEDITITQISFPYTSKSSASVFTKTSGNGTLTQDSSAETVTWSGEATKSNPIAIKVKNQALINYIEITYSKAATDYEFKYADKTIEVDVNSMDYTLDLGTKHPAITFTSEDKEIAEVEDNVIYAYKVGSTKVTASWAEGDGFTAGSKDFTIQVNKLKYTPTFDAVINTVKGDDVTLNVAKEHPDFTYTFAPEGIATITDNVLTAVAQGTTTVTASWGDDEWEDGEATFTVNVNDKRVFTPGFEDIALKVKDYHNWAWDENNCPEIKYEFTEEGIVAFAGSIMSAEKAGKTTVTATWGDDNWAEGNATFTVTVSQKTYKPEFPESLELTVGQDGKFEVEEGAPAVTFTSSNEDGFLIDGNDYVANEVGNYTVKATWGSEDLTNEYAYGEATIAVTVLAAPAAELPVVKNGSEEISRDTWGYELAATTQFTISSTNAAAIRVWKNDELYTNADGKDWAVENGAASVTIEAPALNELVKYVFAGVNTAGEVGQDQFVMTVKLPSATRSDAITRSNFTFSETGYTLSNEYTSNGIGYTLHAFQTNKDCIQIRSANNISGLVVSTNNNGFVLKSIVVKCNSSNSNNVLQIYGKNEAYSAPSELYNTTKQGTLLSSITGDGTLDIAGDYNFVGLKSKSGAIFIDELTFVWAYPTPKQPVADKTVTSLSEGESITWTVEAPCTIKVTKLDGYYGQSAPMRAANAAPDDNWTMSEDGLSATYTASATSEKASYRIVAVNAAGEESKPFFFDVNDNGGVSGIDAVEADDTEAVEYYNLQGVRVEADNLTPGLYITRKGNNISKVVVR